MLSIPFPLPFVPSPPPAPPAVPDSTYWRLVEQWAYYLRTRWLIPNNVTTPPNNWPGTVGPWFNAFFALLYIELNFPAPLADGTLDGKPVRPRADVPIGTNPVTERNRGLPTPPIGTWTYQNIAEFHVKRHKVMITDSGEVIDRSHFFWVKNNHYDHLTGPYLVAWESRPPAIVDVRPWFDGAQDTYEFVWTSVDYVTDIFTDTYVGGVQGEAAHGVWYLHESEVGNPSSRFPTFGVERSWEEIVGYILDPQTFPGDYPAGPITPMPDVYPTPDRIPQPIPEVAPLPLTTPPYAPPVPATRTVPFARPVATTDVMLGPDGMPITEGLPGAESLPGADGLPPVPAEVPVVPAPIPIPSINPSPKPKEITETDLDGLPIPAPGITTKVTDALQHFPWPGADGIVPGGVPATLKGIANEIGRVEAKTSLIGSALDALSGIGGGGGGGPEKEVDGTTYTLTGVCETPNDAGDQPVFSTPIGTQPYSDAVIARLDAMQYLLQAHLGYKTPICGSTEPKPEGDWVTVRFESDANSPNGERPLRKLLRYRTKSGADLRTTTAYWSDFTWQAGPVCVRHSGAWWGSPQVWARDANEGKRVLRHAAREAGIDPDQNGQWSISGSRNPRYGMPGTMRVAQVGGLDWVTKREGPSALPDLAADP